jgi:hypothetical protein
MLTLTFVAWNFCGDCMNNLMNKLKLQGSLQGGRHEIEDSTIERMIGQRLL